MSDDIGGLVVGVIVGIFGLFIAIFLVVALAPVIGQLGGGWYEALFVLLGLLMAFGVVFAAVLGRR